MAKNLPANAEDSRDSGFISGLEISTGIGNGDQLQYFCQENSVDRGSWQATVHEVTKSRTQLSTQAQEVYMYLVYLCVNHMQTQDEK